MTKIGGPEKILTQAHLLIAGTLAPINMMLIRSLLTRRQVLSIIKDLRTAADTLEVLIEPQGK